MASTTDGSSQCVICGTSASESKLDCDDALLLKDSIEQLICINEIKGALSHSIGLQLKHERKDDERKSKPRAPTKSIADLVQEINGKRFAIAATENDMENRLELLKALRERRRSLEASTAERARVKSCLDEAVGEVEAGIPTLRWSLAQRVISMCQLEVSPPDRPAKVQGGHR